MRRVAIALLALASIGIVATVAMGSVASKRSPTQLTIWVGWSARELGVFNKIVAEYNKAHKNVNWKVVGSINDTKIVSAIRSGTAPDVVSSFNSYDVGTYCGTGGWIDLAPLMAKDHISANLFPAAPRYYTQYNGTRCALPLLADDYGLYYNKALFKAAGIKSPPKTMTELAAVAKKLTQRNSDGSLKVIGLNPMVGFYENVPERWITSFGAQWLDAKGHSIVAKSPGWAKWLKWQKALVDWYGYNKLVKWQAGAGDEFSASNAFEVGKVAMILDGEWRVAFLKAEHPTLAYGTAPMPVDDAQRGLYGSGYINGTIVGIPRNPKHLAESWDLVKWLTTNTHALAQLSNGIRNVPTTKASLTSKEIIPDPHFATFLKIFANPKSSTSPITAAGAAYTNLVQQFVTGWQAGKVGDLPAGLSKLDKQLDALVAQAKGGGAP